tara:strand:- start:367 stop:798 length:432 start_codon:yes stop_codon:yes gene_type:complete
MSWEIINLIGSSLVGAFMRIAGSRANAQAEMQKMLIQRNNIDEKSRKSIRENNNQFFMQTRRIISLSIVFAIILVPSLAPIFFDVPIYIQTEVTGGSDYFIFSTEYTSIEWKAVEGIPILSYHKDLMISVVSLYLGSSIASAK